VGSQDKFPPRHCSKFRSSLSLDSLLVHEISLYCLRFDANLFPKFRPRMASVVPLNDHLQILRYQDLIYLDVYQGLKRENGDSTSPLRKLPLS
jgi:hypothetical protein